MITSYSDIASPLLSLIPYLGKAASDLATTLSKRLEKPWDIAFEEISNSFRELDTPVLVVVDDIDRLQTNELLDLLKVVRLIGRFPGVDFLLAYDEETIIETLRESGQGTSSKKRARAFMEKIVQYPLTVPPLLTNKIIKILDDSLTEIVSPIRIETSFEKTRFNKIILTTMPRQLRTPRSIDRFLAQVREQFFTQDLDEMNEVDLILATFLRVQFPDVFAKLQSSKDRLTRAHQPQFSNYLNNSGKASDLDFLVTGLELAEDREDALTVLNTIFPAAFNNNGPRAVARRFAHPDYFDRYLAQTIPDNDIRDSSITEALKTAANGNDQGIRDLLFDQNVDRSMLAISKIRERYPDHGPKKKTEATTGPVNLELLGIAMKLIGECRNDHRVSLTSKIDQLCYWAATLLDGLLHSSPELSDSAFSESLLKCSDTNLRIGVIMITKHGHSHMTQEAQTALDRVINNEANRLLPHLLDSLKNGDNADEKSSILRYELLAASNKFEELKKEIAHGLKQQDFTKGDVAARFVSFFYSAGSPDVPVAASFSGDFFAEVTGIPARSADYVSTEDWPNFSISQRRLFSSQFVE
nr:P-loop NTPase fold protein [Corynebacterium pygosceleis]